MSLTTQSQLHVVLHEMDAAPVLSGAERFELVSALLESGFPVTSPGEPTSSPAQVRGPLLVVGKFPGGARPPSVENGGATSMHWQDITGLTPAQVAERAAQVGQEAGAVRPGEWHPWFPVIDYDRCTHCMQCLSFCLFGVYGVDAQHHLQAQNHDSCKTNCPACSRVCPEAAIMFPKYKAGPINGDVVKDSDLGREKMKIDISALLGGDVYAALRQRSESAKVRFSRERDDKKALDERQKCLAKLAQGGDIPLEVLMSLPSPEEIQRRAEEAKAKAQAALAAQKS